MKQLDDIESEQTIAEIAKFIATSPSNIICLQIGFLNSLDNISEANLLELFRSFAVNQVLREAGITADHCYNFNACKEQAMALLLENNFCLEEIIFYEGKPGNLCMFDAFIGRNKYLRKQCRFKVVKPVSLSDLPPC